MLAQCDGQIPCDAHVAVADRAQGLVKNETPGPGELHITGGVQTTGIEGKQLVGAVCVAAGRVQICQQRGQRVFIARQYQRVSRQIDVTGRHRHTLREGISQIAAALRVGEHISVRQGAGREQTVVVTSGADGGGTDHQAVNHGGDLASRIAVLSEAGNGLRCAVRILGLQIGVKTAGCAPNGIIEIRR
ncbi:hypothetical protein SRABI106_04300 [Rahnella aquatilis]|nr:hypothetical protein SRABI106_04300 [Rahnella aquatilis]